MTLKKRIAIFLLVLVVILAIGGELLLSLFAVKADAAEGTSTTYSNVLDDLKKDSSFNPDDYPDKPDDYSLQVIQVAEGENGELFLYVYQPSNATKDLRAAKINMSLQNPTEKDLRYSLYNLTWLNSNGVFDKYLVNDYKVSDNAYRYYTIATVYRAFDESLGDKNEAGNDDITSYKAYSVGRSWLCYVYNENYICETKNLSFADVKIHSLGYTEYSDGFSLSPGWCDSHFVAFSIENFEVDWVYDADIVYSSCDIEKITISGKEPTINESNYQEDVVITISDKETVEYEGDGWFSHKYTWRRISTLEDFKEETEENTNEFIDAESSNNLNKAQFVIRFLETSKSSYTGPGSSTLYYTYVSDVSVLRLHFLAKGKVYNLGVVADIVSDDGIPDFIVDGFDNIENNFEEMSGFLKLIITIVIGIALYLVLKGPVKALFKLMWSGIKGLFLLIGYGIYGFFWIITWPFRSLLK